MQKPFRLLSALVLLAGLLGELNAGVATLVPTNSVWRFFRGVGDPSPGSPGAWTRADFGDDQWEAGPATFYYGEPGFSGTDLTGMSGQYSTIFLRRTFMVANPSDLSELELHAICDDGFVAYLNGTRIAAINASAGIPPFTALALATATEPVSYADYPIANAASLLLPGENVLAVAVLNSALGSSDLVFAAELVAQQLVPGPPTITTVEPPPGLLTDLTHIAVTFSKLVTGVEAQHFLVNGIPAASVSGSGAEYSFTFPRPAYGTVQIAWGTLNQIRDLGTPPQSFSVTSPGASWNYELLDPNGPAIVDRQPPAGTPLRHLTQILVTFNHSVTGVDAADLSLNGAPAKNVTGFSAGPYVFEFATDAAPGTATLTWRADHGIASDEVVPHSFSGGAWTYPINPGRVPAEVVINEFVAENLGGNKDQDDDPEDWIELHNRGAEAANLGGWALGNGGDAWVFPAVTIPGRGFLRVWASAKDRRDPAPGQELHTNFKLNPTGDTLRLFGPELPRVVVDAVTYNDQGADFSYGRQAEGLNTVWRYFAAPTPGAPNGASTITNTVADVHFSVERGFYDSPFRLSLACSTPGATIRYTTNGGVPLGTNGFVYSGPILINASRVIRAAATLTNHLPSTVRTHTYLYGLAAKSRVLPALSLVSATNNLYGRTGIMEFSPRNTDKHGPAWERPVSVEYIRPEDNEGFQVDAGLRIQGGGYIRTLFNYKTTSLPESKYSYRLYFRGEYGQGKLNYPLFPGTTVESFDTLVLRAGMNDHSNPFIKDELCRQLSSDLGIPASHGTFVHLFLNGVYKGYYNPAERIDSDFLETYHGGGKDWDLIGSFSELREGDAASWNELLQLAQTLPATNQANYLRFTSRLDVTNFVDYLLMPIYVDADDWPHNNWRAARERKPSGLWRFYNWDVEWSFGDPDGHSPTFNTIAGQLSSTSPPWGNPEIARLFNNLKRNSEFRHLFADRVQRAFFNGGALTDENVRRRLEQTKARMQTSKTISGFNNSLFSIWINSRRKNVLQHLDKAGFNRSTNAPGLSQFGGTVPADFTLTLTNFVGPIYYTTDGSDPRLRFTGDVAPTAQLYTTPVLIDRPLRFRTRSLEGTNWSALVETTFQVGEPRVPVQFSEIMYNPPGGEAFEFLELVNLGGAPVDLSGFAIEGVNFRFATPFAALAAGARLILANDANPANFATRYPGVAVAGYFGGSLANGGERLALVDRVGRVVTSVTYGDQGAWPKAADGDGASLELGDANGDPDAPSSWHASGKSGGTPGTANSPAPLPAVRLNEIAAALPGGDWIELHNPGTDAINLAGWSLTDDADSPRKFIFPVNTVIPARGFLVVDASTNAAAAGLHANFGLSANGESVVLFNAATHAADSLAFGPQAAGFSVGRHEADGAWILCDPTPGSANETAATAPLASLTLNEFLANSDTDDDWIELHNTSDLPAVVTGCHLGTSNALFRITAPVFVAAGGFAVLKADEQPGPGHLDFKLPAAGGLIALSDPNGVLLSRVTYAAQLPQVSTGRLPDGTGEFSPLPFSASPGVSNYLASLGETVRFSELVARGEQIIPGQSLAPSDWLELENATTNVISLAGYRLWVDGAAGWTFPAGTLLAPDTRFVVFASGAPAAILGLNLGRDLPDDGATLELTDDRGRLLDRLTYGFQLPGQAAGRTTTGWQLLTAPTPGTANAEPAPLGDPGQVRFNEWLAVSTTGSEWFELLNPGSLPVDLAGHFLTDDPSLSGLTRFAIAPLSFIPAGGFVRFFADDDTGPGPDHLNFRLDQLGETVRLSSPTRAQVDSIDFVVQNPDVSEGRLPDGSARIVRLPLRTPLASNATPDLDLDGDGLPDVWEYSFGLNPDDAADGMLDSDGDGLSNGQEFFAGTNPRNPGSLLGIALDPLPADAVNLRFTAVAGHSYSVVYCDLTVDGAQWSRLANVSAEGATREVTVPDPTPAANRPARFYRVVTPATP